MSRKGRLLVGQLPSAATTGKPHTCTTFVRSKQSIQLTRKTPFCSDMTLLLEIQRYLRQITSVSIFNWMIEWIDAPLTLECPWHVVHELRYILVFHALSLHMEIIFVVPLKRLVNNIRYNKRKRTKCLYSPAHRRNPGTHSWWTPPSHAALPSSQPPIHEY